MTRLADFGRSPVWLNDSRRLVFYGGGKLFLIDSKTGETRQIYSVEPQKFQSFCVSHENRQIYFALTSTEADIWSASVH